MKRVNNPKFVREYATFREHHDWVAQNWQSGNRSIPALKEAVAEMRGFVDRWAGRSGLAEMDAGLRQFGELVSSLERALEQDAQEKLLAVLEKRGDVVIGEMLLKTAVTFIELMKEAPEEMRPALLQIHREKMGWEYEPEREFRESEEDAEENRHEFEQAWQVFAADWPEKATPELLERARTVEGEALGQWKGELAAQHEALAAKET